MLKSLLIMTFLSALCLNANAKELMTPLASVKTANDFTLETPTGSRLSLSDYKGKFVLVNFWAHWCSPCLKEFPDMQNLYEHSDRKNLEIIGIHAGPYNDDAAQVVKRFGVSFPIVSDPDTSLKGWNIPALPTTYLINPQGEIVYQAIGPRSWDVEQMNMLISKAAVDKISSGAGN
jgi:peroxiredoxin